MASTITILDGGMGRQLEVSGAPFRQPEWSALALMEAPDTVRRAHEAFIAAGAEVITTNSYALVPFHIGEDRFAAEGRRLADRAGCLACEAAEGSGRKVLVAGSLPPLFGSYRPDLFDPVRAPALLKVLVAGLSPHVDLWLAETLGSIAEARAVAAALAGDGRPLWLSFTLRDEDPDLADPRLRSGESVGAAASAAMELGAEALLFNCSQPEVMAGAIEAAEQATSGAGARLRIGVYANGFPPQPTDAVANEGVSTVRAHLDPAAYLRFARDWVAHGAAIVGGCCGIGPAHIAALRSAFGRGSEPPVG